MRWRKMLRTMRKNEEIYNPIYLHSAAEAKKLALEEGYPPFHEMMTDLWEKKRITEEQWESMQPLLRKSKRSEKFKKIKIAMPNLYQHRHAVAVLIIVILLTGFFTVTPSGRAFAKQIWDYVVSYTQHSIIFDSGNSNEDLVEQFHESAPANYGDSTDNMQPENGSSLNPEHTIAEFKEVTGSIVALLDNEEYQLADITWQSIGSNALMVSQYVYQGSIPIIIVQEWFEKPDDSSKFNIADDPVFFSRIIQNDIEVYCLYDKKDKIYLGSVNIGHCWVNITAHDGIDIHHLLQNITFK